jgi:hypothetical protein
MLTTPSSMKYGVRVRDQPNLNRKPSCIKAIMGKVSVIRDLIFKRAVVPDMGFKPGR